MRWPWGVDQEALGCPGIARRLRPGTPIAHLRPGAGLRSQSDWWRALVGRCARFAVSLVALLIAGSCALSEPRFVVQGEVRGFPFQGSTNSEESRVLLQEMLAGSWRAPGAWLRAVRLDHEELAGPPDRGALQRIAEEYSHDVATIVFAHQILAQEPNRRMQALYLKNLAWIRAAPELAGRGIARAAAGYTFVFAPAWLYRSHPWNGADFRRPRQLLEAHGIETRLLELAEDGVVEENAAQIAAALQEPGTPGRKRIIVSTSKSGAEVALALGGLLGRKPLSDVAAWINIGGVIRGTPLADMGLTSWRGSLARAWFSLQGWNWAAVESLATPVRRARFAGLRFPEQLLVVNFIGAPLSGDMTLYSRPGYALLREFGPNDGATLLADQIVPGSLTVLQPGADHYFDIPDADLRGLALVKSVLDLVAAGSWRQEMAMIPSLPGPAREPVSPAVIP